MKGATQLAAAIAILILQFLPVFADDAITNVVSPVVSYQYYDSLNDNTNTPISSPIVSYQSYDVIGSDTNSPSVSSVVSYQYFDWLGYDAQKLLSSPTVTYIYDAKFVGTNVSFYGQVLNSFGNFVAGATVTAFKNNIPVSTVTTDLKGTYILPPLAPDVYLLTATNTATADDNIIIALSPSTAQENFSLKQLIPQIPLNKGVANSTTAFVNQNPNGSLLVFDGSKFVNNSSLLNPDVPTIVLTHGFDSSSTAWPTDVATALRSKNISASVNVVAWDWTEAASGALSLAQGNTPAQGLQLGKSLYLFLGANYNEPLDFVGHSLGTLVNRYAINYLQDGQPTGKEEIAPEPWDYMKTHVTLLDEAEDASIFLNSLIPDWKTPIPSSYAWIDNYISLVGEYHSEAVNVYLQKAPSLLQPIDAHAYSHWWYTNSVQNVSPSEVLGFRSSFAYDYFLGDLSVSYPISYYPAGESFEQDPQSDSMLALIPFPSDLQSNPLTYTANQSIFAPQYVVNSTVGQGASQGTVSLQTGQYSSIDYNLGANAVLQNTITGGPQVLDLLNSPDLEATLQTGQPQAATIVHIGTLRPQGSSQDDISSNSPAYGDLKKYIRERFPNGLELSASRLRTFFLQISEALEAVHTSGFVHKDIKSSNVLLFQGRVESNGKRGLLPKLADFGITRKVLDSSHGVEGTWEYMAPEAFDAEHLKPDGYKPYSDIYSLGVLFYEIITGVLPHLASGLSHTEKFAAYETLHKSGKINFSAVRAKMGEEMEALLARMLSVEPGKRPDIGSLVDEINDLIFAAQHGERTAQGTHSIPASVYRWNPFVHEKLKSHLCYYFLKGQNSRNDHLWISDKLKEQKITGYSLYRVIGGIDLIVRIWENPLLTSPVVSKVMEDFGFLQNGLTMRFKVDGFQSISSRPTISFSRLDKIDVNKVIFESLKVDREEEYKALSETGVVIGRLGFDDEKDNFPLRVFAAFRISKNTEGVIQERFIAREIYETLLPFQADKKVASISVYWGAGSYSFLLKIRLKTFEDYELIWGECLMAFSTVYKGVIVQSDTYLELNRVSIRENDDGNIWRDVDQYRIDHRLSWPRTNI